MKIKKIFILLVISIITLPLFANINNQYIVPVDDENGIIDAITLLYIKSNYALPSMTAPYSVAELELMLNQLDFENLDTIGKKKYSYVKATLNSYQKDSNDDVEFALDANINIETYSHLNPTDYIERSTWIRGWGDQKNLLDLNFQIFGDSIFYGLIDFSIGPSRRNEIPFGSSIFQTNIVGITNLSLQEDLETNMPHRAFISMGGSNWNLQVGRDKLNWGAGISGNLLLSDNLKYQDFAKLSLFGSNYKYTYLASFFPHQINYIPTAGFDINTSQLDPLKGFSMFVAHKFEGRSFNNRFGWGLTEALIYASEDSTIDMRAFNPMLSYHSMFTKANCNSILSFDFDFTYSSTTNIYTQIVIDDLVFGLTEDMNSSYSPNAVGVIFGIKHDFSTDNISLISTFEGAYTSPYLYLRDKGTMNPDQAGSQEGYGINYIVAIREFSNTHRESGIVFDKQFLGYKYGGDALVLNFNNRYTFSERVILETNLFAMAHGTNDINTPWSPVDSSAPNVDPGFLSLTNSDGTKTGLSFTGVAGLFTSVKINNHTSTFAQLDAITSINYDHSGKYMYDVQLTTGFSVSL